VLRPGVSRLRDEIEALVGEPVVEVTAAAGRASEQGPVTARVVVGTEAVLHRVEWADVVAFCDFDQELTVPRYRAAEEALALLARASRIVGSRRGGAGGQAGRVLVQTRLPDHVVLRAALQADPGLVAAAEVPLRRAMRFPPAAALALISGAGAEAFLAALGSPIGVEVLGPNEGAWLVRADDHRTLCDALAATQRPAERMRIEVDPLRV
jgi:primosomal protein N' (replication factor Y)